MNVFPPPFPLHAPPPPVPPRLTYQGRTLILCGRGRAPDMHTYSDLAFGKTIDLALVRIMSRTTSHTIVAAPSNTSLAAVLVTNDRTPAGVEIDQWLVVGPFRFDRDCLARADNAWTLEPADQRKAGTVTFIDPETGRWGSILGEDRVKYHWHTSHLRPGTAVGINFLVNGRVRFRAVWEPKGWNAYDIEVG